MDFDVFDYYNDGMYCETTTGTDVILLVYSTKAHTETESQYRALIRGVWKVNVSLVLCIQPLDVTVHWNVKVNESHPLENYYNDVFQ